MSEASRMEQVCPRRDALPTEIWREVVARRNRYQDAQNKLRAGELCSINDLITFNLTSANSHRM